MKPCKCWKGSSTASFTAEQPTTMMQSPRSSEPKTGSLPVEDSNTCVAERGFLGGSSENPPAGAEGAGLISWVGKILWKEKMETHFSICAWESHGQREPGGYSLSSGAKRESDTAYQRNETTDGETHCKQRGKSMHTERRRYHGRRAKSLMHSSVTKVPVTYWKMGTDTMTVPKEENANVSLNVYKGAQAWSCEEKRRVKSEITPRFHFSLSD